MNASLNGPPGNSDAPYAYDPGRLFRRWFAGPDERVTQEERGVIGFVLWKVWMPFASGREIQIECEGAWNGYCNTKAAYTWGGGGPIHLCPAWMNSSRRQRDAVMVHEMTHTFAGLPDHFYHMDSSPMGEINIPGLGDFDANPFESEVLVRNADTYERLVFSYFAY